MTEFGFQNVQLTMCQYQFRWWIITELSTSHYLKHWSNISLTQICVTRNECGKNCLSAAFGGCTFGIYHPALWHRGTWPVIVWATSRQVYGRQTAENSMKIHNKIHHENQYKIRNMSPSSTSSFFVVFLVLCWRSWILEYTRSPIL